ncbi:MAG: hypothetical protein M3Z32_12470 [Acidobacteriota bacterium]|nr:hypothetical protein [Acidobacteriota bacterium]
MRWYELRLNGSGNASIFQQGTYAPDSNARWLGSIALDQSGNMGLGYSVSSSAMHPQIRYTGRLVTDALKTMGQGEGTLFAGNGSQTGYGLARWGDYSSRVFMADWVKTPLMMIHNDADDAVPWYRGIEYYLALRRLGKEV